MSYEFFLKLFQTKKGFFAKKTKDFAIYLSEKGYIW